MNYAVDLTYKDEPEKFTGCLFTKDTANIPASHHIFHYGGNNKWHKKFSLWRLCCVTQTSL